MWKPQSGCGFCMLALLPSWTGFFSVRGCPAHCRMFSSVPVHSQPDATSILWSRLWQPKMFLQMLSNSHLVGGGECPDGSEPLDVKNPGEHPSTWWCWLKRLPNTGAAKARLITRFRANQIICTTFLDFICVNIQYLFSSVWLTSLGMTVSRSNHVSMNNPSLFLFMAE